MPFFWKPLGRTTAASQDSELGLLTTTTQYLSGFTTRTTNPRGYQTTTSYQAFDEPGYDAPTSVAEPGGVTTTISRDVYGKPLSITRSGYWNSTYLSTIRRFVYDAQQRLCKRIDPESAATLMEYDAASNLAWTARSTTLTSTSACPLSPCVKIVVAPIKSTFGGRGQRIGSIRTSIQRQGGGAVVAT